MIWQLEVPTRPVEPVAPTHAPLPAVAPEPPPIMLSADDPGYAAAQSARQAALAERDQSIAARDAARAARDAADAAYSDAHEAWMTEVSAVDAIARQPVKTVYTVTEIGGGCYLASVDIEISGEIERLDYCYAPEVSDSAPAHAQLVGLHQGLSGQVEQPAPPTKSELAAYASDVAWRIEVAGKTVSGIPVKWDERSKVLLMGAAGTLSDEAVAPYVSGSLVVPLTGAQFKAIYAAMVAHTQACFVTRAAVLGQIEAETITTKAQVDAAFL